MARIQRRTKTHYRLWYYVVPAFLFACLICYGLIIDSRYSTAIKSDSRIQNYRQLFKDELLYPRRYNDAAKYIISTATCHITYLDPNGPTISEFIPFPKHYECEHLNLITYQKKFKIFVDSMIVKKYYRRFSKCSYQPYVKRIGRDNAKNLFLLNKFKNVTDFSNVTDEFCMIRCFDKNDKLLSKQQIAFVIRNETLIRLRKKSRQLQVGANLTFKRPMNVVMIVLESTSRLQFIRQMNFTRTYLQSSMPAVELLGYNKVGLNTFPNMVSILLGITAEEMHDNNTFYDRYPFIWKDYMKAGYVTLMGEDNHYTALFNYLRKGFRRRPVDYYMRPYIMALEQDAGSSKKLCSGNVLVLQSLLDKLVDFVASYQDVPHFAFTFIGRPSHDNSNRLGIVDLPLTRTLTDLNTRGLLDNTVLLIFGDHGSRYRPIRNTYQGRLDEENLPVFYVSLPRWFRKEHSDLYENLKANRHKLTSNFDVYATLQDILELGRGHMTPRITGKYGTSLLRSISTNRTCADLKIPIYFCACQSFVETYSTESKIVRDISLWVFKEINATLFNVSHLCSDLTLSSIRQAWRSVESVEDIVIVANKLTNAKVLISKFQNISIQSPLI